MSPIAAVAIQEAETGQISADSVTLRGKTAPLLPHGVLCFTDDQPIIPTVVMTSEFSDQSSNERATEAAAPPGHADASDASVRRPEVSAAEHPEQPKKGKNKKKGKAGKGKDKEAKKTKKTKKGKDAGKGKKAKRRKDAKPAGDAKTTKGAKKGKNAKKSEGSAVGRDAAEGKKAQKTGKATTHSGKQDHPGDVAGHGSAAAPVGAQLEVDAAEPIEVPEASQVSDFDDHLNRSLDDVISLLEQEIERLKAALETYRLSKHPERERIIRWHVRSIDERQDTLEDLRSLLIAERQGKVLH